MATFYNSMVGRCQGLTGSKENFKQKIESQENRPIFPKFEEDEVKLALVVNCLTNESKIEISVSPNKSVCDLTNLVTEKIAGTCPDGIKLLFNSRVLHNQKKLNEIPGLKGSEEIYAVSGKPLPKPCHRQTRRQNVHPYSKNQAHRKLVNCKIFHRNFKSCIDASVRNINPSDRIRHNNPETRTSNVPMVSEAGEHFLEMAKSVQEYALQLNKLSNFLIVDPVLDAEKRENARRMVQNNMDAARYLYPYLQNFSTFVIPLSHSSPRQLMVDEP